MTTDDAQNQPVQPATKLYFQVDGLGGSGSSYFQEVSGLDAQTQATEHRQGNSKRTLAVKPGLNRIGNVTLKKGILAKDSKLLESFSYSGSDKAKTSTVVIKLLDESGKPLVVWTLKNAWFSKILASTLKSEGNRVAVETLEIVCETITMSKG